MPYQLNRKPSHAFMKCAITSVAIIALTACTENQGELHLTTVPGEATIYIDGEIKGISSSGETGQIELVLAAGEHNVDAMITVDEEEELFYGESIQIVKNTVVDLDWKLEPRLTLAGIEKREKLEAAKEKEKQVLLEQAKTRYEDRIKNSNKDEWVYYQDKVFDSIKAGGPYKAIPWLDKAITNVTGDVEPYATAARFEYLFMKEKKYQSDILSFCRFIKEGNMLGGFDFPENMGGDGQLSKDMEDTVCDMKDTLDGKNAFAWGMEVAVRTDVDVSGLRRALPYFDLAEEKGFRESELYRFRGTSHYLLGDLEKAKQDLLEFSNTEQDAAMLRLLAKAQILTSNSDSGFKVGLATLKKAKNLGDEAAKELLNKWDSIYSEKSDFGLSRLGWADASENNVSSFGYTCNGDTFLVAKTGAYLYTMGLPSTCLISSTTTNHSIESIANASCDCYMSQ